MKLLQTEEPYKWQPSSGHFSLKTRILFSLKQVHLCRNTLEMLLLTFVLIKAVYLVGAINGAIWYKNYMEWVTLK